MRDSFPAHSILSLLEGPRTALLGTAKNAGKTTALNVLVANCHRLDAPCGLLSTGVDGERLDGFSARAKPPVSVAEGVLLASADRALQGATATFDWLEALPARTPLGRAHIVRARESGHAMLAGLRHRRDLLHAAARLRHHGASRVFIDGALDRVVSASPALADELLLVTGTPLGATPEEVAEATRFAIERLTLPLLPPAATPLPQGSAWEDSQGKWHSLDPILPLAASPSLGAAVTAGTLRQLRVSGMCASELSRLLLQHPGPAPQLLLPDPSHLLVDAPLWSRLRRSGVQVRVSARAPLRALLLNPAGSGLSPEAFGERFAAHLNDFPDLPLFDLVGGWCRPTPRAGGDGS